jgi:hypothetical protein
VTCLPTIGSARSGRDNSELARLRGLVSDPGATISLRQVMDAFLQRPGGGPTPRRVRARQLRDPRYNLVAFRGGDVVVGFYGRKGREDARRNLRMLRRMDARTRRNLVGSLCRKTARSHDYFKRLLAATGNSGKLPRRVLFYVGQDRQYFARAGEKGVYLGYRMLLERYGQVIHHELFHQVARQVLKRGEERFYSATALNEGLADYFAAVACNQPRVAGWRQVKNRFNERDDGQRLRGQSKHHYGQLFSGMLWELRKAINRASGTPWGEVSPADRLALVAFRDRIHESSRKSCDLRGWIDALVATDRALSGGRYLGQIRRVGGRFLGGGFETSR